MADDDEAAWVDDDEAAPEDDPALALEDAIGEVVEAVRRGEMDRFEKNAVRRRLHAATKAIDLAWTEHLDRGREGLS